jgi:hypothetical protein
MTPCGKPVLIEDYFRSLLLLLTSLPYVDAPQISLEKRADTVGFIRGDIEFADGSQLHFRELIDLRLPMKQIMYAYHYRRRDGTLVFRYDNTRHHSQIRTYPDHKHTGGGVISANAPSLEAVLREIEPTIASAKASEE